MRIVQKEIPFGPGDVKWDPKDGMYTSENIGGTTFRVVEIELKKPGGGAAVLQAVGPLEFENDQVRVVRVKFGARRKIAVHEHSVPRIVVPLTDVHLQVTTVDGKQSSLKAKQSDAIFSPAGRHREESLMDTPTELILIELKN